MKKSKIQTLLDKVEKINSDMDCDTMELNEAYAELGKAVDDHSQFLHLFQKLDPTRCKPISGF